MLGSQVERQLAQRIAVQTDKPDDAARHENSRMVQAAGAEAEVELSNGKLVLDGGEVQNGVVGRIMGRPQKVGTLTEKVTEASHGACWHTHSQAAGMFAAKYLAQRRGSQRQTAGLGRQGERAGSQPRRPPRLRRVSLRRDGRQWLLTGIGSHASSRTFPSHGGCCFPTVSCRQHVDRQHPPGHQRHHHVRSALRKPSLAVL
jgi:hypothetical protein